MSHRNKNILGIIVALALALLVAALAVPAHADEQEFSPQQLGWFAGVVISTDEWAQDKSSFMMSMVGPTVRKSLEKHLSDATIIALWRAQRAWIRDTRPRAWAIISTQVEQIRYEHRYEPGSTYKLDY